VRTGSSPSHKWNRLALAGLVGFAACAAPEPTVNSPQRSAPPARQSPPKEPAPPASNAKGAEGPEARARAFVDALTHQQFEAAAERFDADMAKAMPKTSLADLWRTLEDAGGPFQNIEGAETTEESGYRVVRVTCRFAHLRKVLSVVFVRDDAIAGLFFGPLPKDLEDSARAVVEKLARGDYQGASAGFDTIMKGSLPPDKLRAVWARAVRRVGPFAEVESATIAPAQGLWTVLLTCRFGSGPLVVKVVYDVRDQIAGLFLLPGDALAPWKPPPYARLDSFTEREVSVGASPSLPGTLSLPKGQGPFSVVVLVHGSGPSDADASLGPNKIFKDLAWGLASRGVAALRYVKRTRHAPAAVASVNEEVLDGARAAVDLVLHTRELDPKRVVVAGHSQGGYLAPRIAAENAGVAAILLLAAPSRPLQDSMLDQLTYFLKLDPNNDEKKRLVAAARAFKAKVEDPGLKPDDTLEVPFGGSEKGAYFLSLRGYRPTDVAAKLSIPILVLQGDRDYQVTATDLDGWKRSIGDRPNVGLKRYAPLNHLFIAGTGTPRPGEYEAPGHVNEGVIGDIAAFVGRLPAGLP
jgi:dienelactone hydrolase